MNHLEIKDLDIKDEINDSIKPKEEPQNEEPPKEDDKKNTASW